MKRIAYIVSFILFFFILITPAFADCAYSGSGDWNITETDDCTNTSEVIWLNDDLTIYGNLTFDNVTLLVNSSSDGDYGIYVNSGGIFNITGDTSYSNITNGEVAGASYIFHVKSGSTFEAHDSYISKAGWQNVNYHRGIDIYTNNVIMENNTISSDYKAIYIEDSSNNIFTDNTITSNNIAAHIDSSSNNNQFINNSISTPGIGVYLDETPLNNTFINNSIHSSDFEGIRVFYSENNTFTNNNISGKNDESIYFYQGNYNNLTNNTIYNSNGARTLYLEWSTNNTFTNNTIYSSTATYVLYFDYAWNNILIDNNISGTNEAFYLFKTYDSIIANNTISSTSNYGMEFYDDVTRNIFTNNNISAYSYGIFLDVDAYNNTFTDMNISSTNDIGIYSLNSNRNIFINSTISSAASSDDIYLRGTGNLTTINSSFNRSKVGFFAGTTADLFVKWYLDVNVTDSNSIPIQDANVSGYNVTNGFTFTDQTGASGSIDSQPLKEYTQNITNTYYETNYTINVTKSGYIANSTEVNLTGNTQVNITLEGKRSGGSACTLADQCSSGYCVHNICRSASIYCGDSYCDTGETCSSCSADCGACVVSPNIIKGASGFPTIPDIAPSGEVNITEPEEPEVSEEITPKAEWDLDLAFLTILIIAVLLGLIFLK